MRTEDKLLEAFNKTGHKIGGHGKRDVRVLKDYFEDIDGDTASDMYGKGETIERFQAKMADYLGKPSAVFFPSGTMAQQIALRIWSDDAGVRKVAYHPLSHLEIHEENGMKELHRIEAVLLADKDRLITLEDVKRMDAGVPCLLLELPQREIGGQLPAYAELEAIAGHCRERGIKLHLDGARLFEILPYYGKTAAELCGLFDSVYVSFYKGLGGIAGAILAGEETFAARAKVWKRRHGGDLISLYPYILSSDKAFDSRIGKMGSYYEDAVELAALFNGCDGLSTLPKVPVSNMFHVHSPLPKDKLEAILIGAYEASGVGMTAYLKETESGGSSFEVSIGDRYASIPKEQLEAAFRELKEGLRA